jgi:Rrf2 family transcriptional regulator, cysteine metabolism repressor
LSARTYHSTGAVSFSTKGEYGVRLMAQLAARHGTGPASLSEIAEQEELPRAYLEQLVMSLRDADLVRSTRGAHGGYELARPPEMIQMGEVLRALEGPIAPMICATEEPGHAACTRSGHCTVNSLWTRVRDAIVGALDSMTLADLVPVVDPASAPPSAAPASAAASPAAAAPASAASSAAPPASAAPASAAQGAPRRS